MSYIPIRESKALEEYRQKSFFGLNRSETAAAGEFFDMKNMSCRRFPYLSPRMPRADGGVYNKIFKNTSQGVSEERITGARAIISVREDTEPVGFSGVIGNEFYYNGYKKPMKKPAVYNEDGSFKLGMEIDLSGKIQLLWANRIIIIHGYDCENRDPYVYYYNTDDCGKGDDYVKSYEYKLESYYTPYTIEMKEDGTGEIEYLYKTGRSFTGGYFDFCAGDSVFIDDIMTYSDSRWKEYGKGDITSAVVTDYSETSISEVSGTVTWRIKLTLKFYNNKGEQPFSSPYSPKVEHIYKKIPYMTQLAVHKGRLWGANPNGEYIYASALGDLFNFNCFENLSGDSAYLESSSQGGYLGVISCGNVLVSLKKNELEAIYGELPNEFAVGKSYTGYGCSDIESCAVVDNSLYFLGDGGFYVWSGMKPVLISECLSKEYISAFAYSDGQRYYASAKDEEGNYENLVFDIKRSLWHAEDDRPAAGYFGKDGERFILAEDGILKINSDSGEENFDWYAESAQIFSDDYKLNRICEIWLKAKLFKNSEVYVHARSGDSGWRQCGYLFGGAGKKKIYRVPVRVSEGDGFEYRLSGKGDCIVYGIRLYSDNGGRLYSNERADIE